MSGGLFYNIHPHVDEERVIDQWRRWMPPAALVMNNPNYAMRLQAARPDALVIARITDPFGRNKGDDNIADMPAPAVWLMQMMALVPDPRVVLYAGNEIHTSPDIAEWTVEAMNLATAAGRRLCILNCGTGGPEDEEWWADAPPTSSQPLDAYRIGALEPVARAWAESNHILGLHEYADHLDWRQDRGFQVARYERHLDTFAAMGIAVPREELRKRLAITEATMDSTDHSEYKGARHLPAEEAARQMIEMDREVYQGIPVLMYCMGHNSDPQWRLFRLDYAGGESAGLDEWGATFQNAIDAYMIGELEAESMPETIRATVNVKRTVNRRAEPAGAEVDSDLLEGARVMDVSEDAFEAELGGTWYLWRYFAELGEETGYYSATGTPEQDDLWIEVEPLPVEEPAPDPEPTPEPPADDHAEIMAAIAALQAELASVRAEIAEIRDINANHYRSGYAWMLEGAEAWGGAVSTLVDDAA